LSLFCWPLPPATMPSHCWRCRCLCRRHYRHDATSVVATARHGFAPSLLLIVVCYLLLSASAVAIVVTNMTSASAPPSLQPPLPVLSLPLWQSPSGQEAPAEDGGSGHHGQVLFGREVKKVYFSPQFTYQRAFFSRWPEPVAFGGNRNPPESSRIRRIPG
jgi:hypothetical protein